MAIFWSDCSLQSLEEIILYYETQAGGKVAQTIEERIFQQVEQMALFPEACPASPIFPGMRKVVFSRLPYVAFIRQRSTKDWEVVDIVHTSRKLPKTS